MGLRIIEPIRNFLRALVFAVISGSVLATGVFTAYRLPKLTQFNSDLLLVLRIVVLLLTFLATIIVFTIADVDSA